MIKLSFSGFKFLNDGIVSKGKVIATIKYFTGKEWDNIGFKEFKTKVTYKSGDKFNLNKAYQIIKAKLEKDAYKWAASEAQKEINNINKEYRHLKDFVDKANHIIVHNTGYIVELNENKAKA